MGGFTLVSLFALVIVAVNGATLPLLPNCNEKVEYWKSGSTYRYEYSARIVGRADETTDRLTGTKMKCKVDFSATGQCRYVLKVHECDLYEIASSANDFKKHVRNNDFSTEMSKHPVSILMSNGQVHKIIVDDKEPKYITNIKRGIISNLQGRRIDSAFLPLKEKRTDVHGTCPTRYENGKNKDEIVIVKNMNECAFPNRPDWELSPSSLFWNATFFQAWILNTHFRCVHELKNNALQKSKCDERYSVNYDPDTQRAKAQTVAEYKLELQRVKDDKVGFDHLIRRKFLLDVQYEWEPTPTPTKIPDDFENRAKQIVSELVTSTHEEIKPDTNDKFDQLVSLLRQTSDVGAFVQGVWQCSFKSKCDELEEELARSFVRDALATCNTEPCLEGIRWLAVNNHLSESYLKILLFKLTKVRATKPGYLNSVYDICEAKPSRSCFLSLTSMIHSYVERNPEQVKDQPPRAIQKTIEYLDRLLGSGCKSEGFDRTPPQTRAEKYILALKSIGTLGQIAATSSIIDKIERCIAVDKPSNVSIEALKSLRRFAYEERIYDVLMGVIRNTYDPTEKRVIAYMVLTTTYHEKKFFDDLANIIHNDLHGNNQFRNFVTMHMNNVLQYGDPSLKKLKTSISEVLRAYPHIFELRGIRPMSTSRHREKARFFESPLFHDLMNKFGYDISAAAIHEPFSFLPQHLFLNITTELFGNKLNTATFSAALHGLDPYIEYFFGYKISGIGKSLGERFKMLQEKDYDIASLLRRSDWNPNFDNEVERRLTEIHDSVILEYGKQQPSGSFSLKRYGDEVAYTSFGLIRAAVYNFMETEVSNYPWHEKNTYRVHRLIRFIESFTQIPLLAGLPLKWQLNGDLGLSLRLKTKINPFTLLGESKTFHAEWEIDPSGAISIDRQMLVEVPNYISHGFRIDSTIYRSRQRGGAVSYADAEFNLKIKVPQRPQQIVNLYIKHSLIRDGKLEEIQDHNVQRSENEKCLSSQYLGLKLCKYHSYGDVGDRNPFEILSSKFEYRLWFELDDKDLREYNLLVKCMSKPDSRVKEIKFEFNAPGTKWRREINGRYSRNLDTNEFDLQVNVPEKPHFKLVASRKRKAENHYATDIEAEIYKGWPVTIHGERQTKSETKTVQGKGSVPNLVKEYLIAVKVKDHIVNWKRAAQTYSGVIGNAQDIDHYISYESLSPNPTLRHLLLYDFWESPTKAKAHLHSHIDQLSTSTDDIKRATDHYLATPNSILEARTLRITGHKNRRALHLNITKRSLPDHKLEAFLNLTYDMYQTETGGKTHRNHIVKAAIPYVVWVARFDREFDEVDNNNLASLARYKSNERNLDNFNEASTDKWGISFQLNHHNASRARNDQWPAPRERHIDAILRYPRDGAQQTLSYKLNIINDEAKKNAGLSFQTVSTLECSYRGLKLQDKSNFIANKENIKLDYNAEIDNVRTGNKATYKAQFDLNYKFPIVFNSNYQSSRYTLTESLIVKKTGATDFDIDLEIHGDCPEWDFLTFDLIQKCEVKSGTALEKMQFRHKYVDVDVKAEYKFPFGSYAKKLIQIKSKNEIIPRTNIYIDWQDQRKYSMKIEYPDEERNVYALLEADPNDRNLSVVVSRDHKGSEKRQILTWDIQILAPDLIAVNSSINRTAFITGRKIFLERFAKLKAAWDRIKDDPDHPMNKYLRPIVKTTVGDYIRRKKEAFAQFATKIQNAAQEALINLEPIYGHAIRITINLVSLVGKGLSTVSAHVRPEGINYSEGLIQRLQLDKKLSQYFEGLIYRINARIAEQQSKSDGSTVIAHPFKWPRLKEIPQPTPKLVRLLSIFTGRYTPEIFPSYRYALLYGLNNVFTFDGHAYQFPQFPDEKCLYILTHNFLAKRFSLLIQDNSIHLLLPDSSYTFTRNKMIMKNKTPVKLPISEDYVSIAKVGENDNHVTITTNDIGISLDLDFTNQVVLLGISTWHHNRTLGLLGNNDNEERNDFKERNGKETNRVKAFLNNYEVSGKDSCSFENTESDRTIQLKGPFGERKDKGENNSCYHYYEKRNFKSPLYACFDIVKPDSFLRGCLSDSRYKGFECSSYAAYRAICGALGVHLSLPEECENTV